METSLLTISLFLFVPQENNNNQSMVAELQKKFEETKDVNEEQEVSIALISVYDDNYHYESDPLIIGPDEILDSI